MSPMLSLGVLSLGGLHRLIKASAGAAKSKFIPELITGIGKNA
jgi:hypothetical protein